jgi:hypothetical protein
VELKKRQLGSTLARVAVCTDVAREMAVSYGRTGEAETADTPASMNGFDRCSFHQNCRSTRRHSGSVGKGSANTSTSSPLAIVWVDGSRASSSASRTFCFRVLAICSCLCCRECVISDANLISRLGLITPVSPYRNRMQNTSLPWRIP